MLLALGAVPAGAVTINADGTQCSLQNAIRAANRNAQDPQNPLGACTNGSTGSDTINLLYDVDISSAATANAGLPDISSVIILNGNKHTIKRVGTNNFRLLYIAVNGNLTLNDITLKDGKEPTLDGGAIYNVGALSVKNSAFDNNQCTLDGCRGGAIRNSNSLTIDNSTFTNNTSNGSYGGAIYNTLIITNLSRSTFSNNTSYNSLGGAIYNDSGSMTLSSNTFNNNSGPQGGGAIANSAGIVAVDNCTFNSNSSSENGGAIYNFGNGGLTLFLSTFISNSAANGGAISLGTATTKAVDMWGNLISGNSATGSGSNIYSDGTTTISSSYNLLGDSGSTYAQSLVGYTLDTSDINANQTLPDNNPNPASTALTNILNTTLDYNGGPTKTHALVLGSPAIDIIDSAALCLPGDLDQRGYYRANGNANDTYNNPYSDLLTGNTTPPQTVDMSFYGNTKCDMGAYEFSAKPVDIKGGSITYTTSRTGGPTFISTDRYSIKYKYFLTNQSMGPLHNVVFKLNTVCFLDKTTPSPYTCLAGTAGFLSDGGSDRSPGWPIALSNAALSGGSWDNTEIINKEFEFIIPRNKGLLRYSVDVYADPATRQTLGVAADDAAAENQNPEFLENFTFDVELTDPEVIPKRTLSKQEPVVVAPAFVKTE